MPPEFFVDRSLGSDAVPAALRAVGAEVVTMRALWGEAEAQARPHPLPPAEQLAFRQAGLRGFVLTNGNLKRAQMAAYFVDNPHTIRRLAEPSGPYIFGVYRTRVERLWP